MSRTASLWLAYMCLLELKEVNYISVCYYHRLICFGHFVRFVVATKLNKNKPFRTICENRTPLCITSVFSAVWPGQHRNVTSFGRKFSWASCRWHQSTFKGPEREPSLSLLVLKRFKGLENNCIVPDPVRVWARVSIPVHWIMSHSTRPPVARIATWRSCCSNPRFHSCDWSRQRKRKPSVELWGGWCSRCPLCG